MTSFGLLVAGILLLLGSGMSLVRGASAVAGGLGVSPMIIGLTVVAFGTSAPELVVNVMAAIEEQPAIAFGNVVGSNIANLGLVLGAAGLFAPIAMQSQLLMRELPLLLLVTSVLFILALDVPLRGEPALLDSADGIVLLLLFSLFIYVAVMDVLGQRKDPLLRHVEHLPVPTPPKVRSQDWLYTLGGVLGLAVGGHLTITHGAALADSLGISKAAIGIAVVAVGTSLPELVTSVIAAIKQEPDLSVGNVVGSNLFNALLVLPVGAVITPVAVPAGGSVDLLVSLLFALALIPIFLIGHSLLGRSAAAMLLGGYVAFIGYRMLAVG